jgi:predicted transcriptional regulator
MIFQKDTLTKILDKITGEWQSRSDIVGWTGLNRETVRTYLPELERQGKIESMWDGNLGIRYYRRGK